MTISPVLALHICAGTVGFLSGAAALFLRKGSRNHRGVGNVFVISMLALSATGVSMALVKRQPGNVLGGTLTFYLVATAWMVGRRRERQTSIFDWAGLIVASTLALVELTFGFQAANSATGLKYDYPPGPYFFMGSIALMAAVGDLRMLFRGGISGGQRIARHLWRMCFALFIASGSIFLARQHLFPVFLRKTGALFALSFFPLVLMIFWLIRVRMTGARKRKPVSVGGDVPPLAA